MKKLYSIIFTLLFIAIFSYFYSWEFIDFQKNKEEVKTNISLIEEKKQNFSLDKIREIKETEFSYSPSKELLENIVSKMNNSKKRIYLEVYMLTENKLKDALKKAKDKWIDVKVVLEKNPYMAFNINNKTYDFLSKNNINVVWSNLENYALNHSKFIIIDNELVLASWNFTYSTFSKNRDIFLFIKDSEILTLFEKIFELDFKWEKSSPYNDSLVISPDYSRNKIENLFKWAIKNIDMYFPYLADENLKKILFEKVKSWVKVRLIVDKVALKDDSEQIDEFKKAWIEIKDLKKNKVHAKAVLIDQKYLYVWSENFSTNSLDKNRETWILLKNEDIIAKFQELFNNDFEW